MTSKCNYLLHAEMVCTLPFISTEINVISLGQALPSGKFDSAGGLICIDSV